jgi:hypothetical protein
MNIAPTLIVHPVDIEQVNVIKAFFKALKIQFEVTKETPYNRGFVEKIEKSRAEFATGDFIRVEKENIDQFLGL